MGLRSCRASDVQPYVKVVTIVIALITVGYVLICGTEYRFKFFNQRFIYPPIFSLQMKKLEALVLSEIGQKA